MFSKKRSWLWLFLLFGAFFMGKTVGKVSFKKKHPGGEEFAG
jgi:hypothetical protein